MWTVSLPSKRRVILATALLVFLGVASASCGSSAAPAPRGTIASTLGISELSVTSLQALEYDASVVYEEQLATCMKGEGFEYRREVQSKPALQDRAETNTEAEFVERHGWGIVDSLKEQGGLGSSGVALGENAEIYANLSPGAREAYDVAREGSATEDGCETFAADASRAAVPGFALADQYADQIEQTVERFATDLRIVAFHRKWSTCMIEFGFDYDSPNSLSRDITKRATGLPDDPLMSRDAWLAEMLDVERDAADASLQCGVGPSVYGQPQVYDTVLDTLEQRFLSENPEFLRARE